VLAATQDSSLMLGVGYDCSCITSRKENAVVHRSRPRHLWFLFRVSISFAW